MALNSRRLLQSLGIAKVTIVGHSMGGMLSARFAASFPDIIERAGDLRSHRPDRSALRAAVAERG
jgi:pimeloyl-ACP methyl ester carboxylesterase